MSGEIFYRVASPGASRNAPTTAAPGTEEAYVGWIRRFILCHHRWHPAEMAKPEISRFLSSLALSGRVSATTQTQALSALLFLYRDVLRRDVGWVKDVVKAKAVRRLPVVMTHDDVRAVVRQIQGENRLAATLLDGAGLRVKTLDCRRPDRGARRRGTGGPADDAPRQRQRRRT